MSAVTTAYDTFAYPSSCYPQAHPDRLATLATLFGMTPAPVERCRVLEIGCANGRNLLGLAFALPGSTFVGVDIVGGAIDRAKDGSRDLGLANVEFHCADLLDWPPPDEPFDYVIAHGFISWVPEAVRRRVFELCRERLTPQGVAYVSYNALPGWHISGMLRQMMQFHTRHFPHPAQKIPQAVAFLRLLAAGHAAEGTPAAVVKKEAQRILDRGADAVAVLCHDELSEFNRPLYFHEVAALAGAHRLQFLAEADFEQMQDSAQPPAVVAALKQLSGDVILKEQYLDFLKCRRFRQTLLSRGDVALIRELKPGVVRQFLVASRAQAEAPVPDLSPGAVERFAAQGVTVEVDDPLTKAALLELRAAWPRALPLGELMRAASRRLDRQPGDQGEGERLAGALLAAYAAGAVEFHLYQAAWAVAPGGRPVLSPLARLQLAAGQESVTSLRHADTRVDAPITRAMLLLLDGTRDVAGVAGELGRRLDAGELALPAGAARQDLPANVALGVREAAAGGLLIAWDATVVH